jgi:anthranilate synthase component 2
VIRVGRYHSLIVKKDLLTDELKVTASTSDGEIMGVQHKKYPVYGVQFHPESIMTPDGKEILKNFLKL